MRYGREVTIDGQVRLTEVVDIPASAQSAPAAWLAVALPHLSAEGWIHVADANVAGAVKNGSVYDNPAVSGPTKPKDYSKAEFKAFCYVVLGAVADPSGSAQEKLVAGISAFGALRRAASASSDDAVFQALDEYNKADVFEKAKTLLFLSILNGTNPKICSDAQLAALSSSWENI